jgi:hypothetical protein
LSITVHIKYKDVEETFTGDVDNVWISINRFFSQTIPLFDAAHSAVLTVDLKQVIESSKDLVAVADEGPIVLVSKQKLTDNESLLLKLLAAYIGGKLGVLDKMWLSRDELQGWLGKSGKITGTRLGELCREGLAVKTEEGGYRLSTLGVIRLVDGALAQIRSKN